VRVLHVITGLAAGGAETQLRLLLQHSRHDADVVALYNAGSVAQELRADGVAVRDLGMASNRQIGALGQLVRLMRSGRYDVVHTHLYRACVYGRLAARVAGVPRIVATEHSALDGQLEGRTATPAVRRLYRTTERLGSTTVAVSPAVVDELTSWGIAAERIVCIPNGLDLDRLGWSAPDRERIRAELGIPSGARVIGAVGRLHPGKRYDLLLAAAAPLLTDDRRLLLVGEGSERAALEERARSLGIADRVLFAGERPATPLLSAMDVFASPSPYETFGLALLEAVANGLPVVYRRSPALDELGDAVPGVAVRGTDAEVFSGAIRAVLHRAGPPDVVSRHRPAALDRYAISHVARRVDDLYETIDTGRPDSSIPEMSS
jgi:glycosyltransferase involved in cell wall biosynthesis